MKEIWKVVDGYPDYQISNRGNLMSFKTNTNGRLMKLGIDKDGYHRVRLYGKPGTGEGGYYYIHRLVALAFIPNPNNLPQVNHIEPVEIGSCDDSVENLEWCTVSDNLKHKFKLGRQTNKGENGTSSKLSNKDVLNIVKLINEGKSQGQVAKLYPVDRSTIGKIVRGERWSHITGIQSKAKGGRV